MTAEDRTETCQYCGTSYVVPAGFIGLVETTRDMPPPARVAVWKTPTGQRWPDWPNAEALHHCERGVSFDA